MLCQAVKLPEVLLRHYLFRYGHFYTHVFARFDVQLDLLVPELGFFSIARSENESLWCILHSDLELFITRHLNLSTINVEVKYALWLELYQLVARTLQRFLLSRHPV